LLSQHDVNRTLQIHESRVNVRDGGLVLLRRAA
jgi:hypothetical protein